MAPRLRSIDPPAVAAHLARLDAEAAPGGVTRRKAQGAHYTPPAIVAHLCAESLDGWQPPRAAFRAIDPACGSGNFLVALARLLVARGFGAIETVLETHIHGVDIDPAAIELARAALLAELPPGASAPARRRVERALGEHVVVGDALAPSFPLAGEFDLILGNPPFLNQLEQGTAVSRGRARAIAEATGGAVSRYADIAAAFLLTNLARLAPNGRLGFVMPLSFLSTGDARPARDAALGLAELRAIWASRASHFDDASVRVCTLVFARDRRGTAPRRAFGCDFAALPAVDAAPNAGDPSWSPILAEGFGAPRLEIRTARTIAEIAVATADFRDQYYGLAGALREAGACGEESPRLVTTRHIDLARCAWGERPVRVLGQRFSRPVVDRDALASDAAMTRWLGARLVPKIIVATQTKVIEAWVDERGAVAPLVPLITVEPREGTDLWLLAAAVASPVVAARALALYAGSALSPGAIKLSAKQLLAMPLPIDLAAWRESAAAFREASCARDDHAHGAALLRFARRSCASHALEPRETAEVLRFWLSRAGLGEYQTA